MTRDTALVILAISTWIALGGFAASTAAYWILAPWYKTRIGRNFMFLLITLTFTLGLVVFSRLIPSPEVQLYLFIVVYGLFALSGIAFAVNIIREQITRCHPKKNTSIDNSD